MEPDLASLRGPFAGTAGHLDAPYAQTPAGTVEAMLDFAALAPGERLLDLGSGDGRIVIAAARRGADATGIDIDPGRIAEVLNGHLFQDVAPAAAAALPPVGPYHSGRAAAEAVQALVEARAAIAQAERKIRPSTR